MNTTTTFNQHNLGKRFIEDNADTLQSNIDAYYQRSLDAGISADNTGWYNEQQIVLQNMADRYNVDFVTVAAITAHVSPMIAWAVNIKLTETTLQFCADKTSIQALTLFEDIPTLNKNAYKAVLTYYGYEAKFGPKTGAFFQNLCGNHSVVTIDRHAIALILANSNAGDYSISPQANELAQQLYKNVADKYGVSAALVQSNTWEYRQQVILGKN